MLPEGIGHQEGSVISHQGLDGGGLFLNIHFFTLVLNLGYDFSDLISISREFHSMTNLHL